MKVKSLDSSLSFILLLAPLCLLEREILKSTQPVSTLKRLSNVPRINMSMVIMNSMNLKNILANLLQSLEYFSCPVTKFAMFCASSDSHTIIPDYSLKWHFHHIGFSKTKKGSLNGPFLNFCCCIPVLIDFYTAICSCFCTLICCLFVVLMWMSEHCNRALVCDAAIVYK